MSGHPDDRRCDDYEVEPFLVDVDPAPDQCGMAGHGSVFVTFKADVVDSRMAVGADCDYLTATVQLTLGEVDALCNDLSNAASVVWQKMTRQEFKQIVGGAERTTPDGPTGPQAESG